MPHSMVCYVSVDIETSAPKPVSENVSMISLGACIVGMPEYTFYVEIKPDGSIWTNGAEEIHRLSPNHLRKYGMHPKIAMIAFTEWVKYQSSGAIPIFCATPIDFDWAYVNLYLRRYNVGDPFSGGQLDGRQLYRSLKGIPRYEDVPRDVIWKEFPTSLPHIHNALDDALEQEEVFRQMLKAGRRL